MHQTETVRGHSVPGWLAPALVMAISLLTVGWADATPQQALQYVDPGVASAKAQLALREQALTPLHQMDATLTADPSVTYSDVTTNADPPAWAANLDLNANVGYSYNRPAILGNLYNLVRAQDNVSSTLRRGIYNALYAQARMLQYQVIVTQTEAQVASATDDVARVAAQLEAGKARRSDLEQRKLRLQSYQLRLDQYKQELQNIQDEAAGYGMDRHASYQPVRFILPGARVEDTANYKLRDLNVKRTEAAVHADDALRNRAGPAAQRHLRQRRCQRQHQSRRHRSAPAGRGQSRLSGGNRPLVGGRQRQHRALHQLGADPRPAAAHRPGQDGSCELPRATSRPSPPSAWPTRSSPSAGWRSTRSR